MICLDTSTIGEWFNIGDVPRVVASYPRFRFFEEVVEVGIAWLAL